MNDIIDRDYHHSRTKLDNDGYYCIENSFRDKNFTSIIISYAILLVEWVIDNNLEVSLDFNWAATIFCLIAKLVMQFSKLKVNIVVRMSYLKI